MALQALATGQRRGPRNLVIVWCNNGGTVSAGGWAEVAVAEEKLEERVDDAGLAALKSFDPEDMVDDLDHISDTSSISLTDLYRRWERQNWSAYALDFAQDRKDWLGAGGYTTPALSWRGV